MANDLTGSWSTRYAAASAQLDDTAHLVEIWRRLQALLHRDEPSADFFGTDAILTGARSLGLFAGTFNPLTLAHTALVEQAQTRAGIDRVLWILAVTSVDKESVVRASLVDRLVQLLTYVAGTPACGVVVVNQGLYVDEVDIVRAHIPDDPDLVVLVGYDKIVQIMDPRYYNDRSQALDELFSRARFLVAPRDNAANGELEAFLAEPDNRAYRRRVSYLPVPPHYREDSATAARQRAGDPAVTAGELSSLLPPEGAALALETGAYATVPNMASDAYLWRNAWIAALGAGALPLEGGLPGMKRLLQATMDPGERGSALRASVQASLAEPAHRRDLLSLFDGI